MSTTNIRSYSFGPEDRLFFDTNIWLEISNPFANAHGEKARVYSKAYQEIIHKGIKIFIDICVISEFINRCARLRFEQWKEENSNSAQVSFKTYRATDDYTETIRAVENAAQSFMADCAPLNTPFSHSALRRLISECGNSRHDFNDLLIAEVCKAHKLTLVTDDGDFRDLPIPILTYNSNLLR